MKALPTLLLLEETAAELHREIARSPFHASEGVELRKQAVGGDLVTCVGYILGPEETVIYRRNDSRRDRFVRERLWFFYGWLIKPRPFDRDYRELETIPTSQFTENMLLDLARKEFAETEGSFVAGRAQ